MLFCSLQFLLFFTVVFSVYWAMPWHKARVWLLLTASFYFYANWNYWLAAIIAVSTTLDYLIGRGLDGSSSPACRRLLLACSLVGNLGLLAYFKYVNFFLRSVEALLHEAGDTSSLPVLQVIVPIGISFYTFEAINYTVDIYRGKAPAERNLGYFMLFITFFPHLIAGPIVRAKDFLPQIRRLKRWDWARLELGAQYMLLGLFKKLAIADHLALYVDPVFADPTKYSSEAVWIATLAYALQIYCDFSGYTDMAIGTAHMLGYKLAKNFNLPYIAVNISEFWHRWHISLSTWLRDYLFIPLGGSRGTRLFVARNLMITMILGGLWHGASWTFAFWGFLHGALLILHRIFREFCQVYSEFDVALQSVLGTMLRRCLTFLAVAICWIFFRSISFNIAVEMMDRLIVRHGGLGSPLPSLNVVYIYFVFALGHVLSYTGAWKIFRMQMPAPAIGLSYAAMLSLTLILAPGSSKTFIYFQF